MVNGSTRVPRLHDVAKAPEILHELPMPTLAAIAAQASAEIATRLAAQATEPETDRWVTAEEAAPLLGMTTRYLRRNAGTFPFTRRPSPGRVAFSLAGIKRFMERRSA